MHTNGAGVHGWDGRIRTNMCGGVDDHLRDRTQIVVSDFYRQSDTNGTDSCASCRLGYPPMGYAQGVAGGAGVEPTQGFRPHFRTVKMRMSLSLGSLVQLAKRKSKTCSPANCLAASVLFASSRANFTAAISFSMRSRRSWARSRGRAPEYLMVLQ